MEDFATVSVERWILIGWAVFCGGFDLWRRRLPNLLTLGGSAAALTMLLTTGHGWMETPWTSCSVAAIVALLLTLPAYVVRMLGAGDVKLLVSVGLLGGMKVLLITYAFAGLLVGLVTIVWVWVFRWEAWFAYHVVDIGICKFSIPEPKGRRLPFGFAVMIGFSIAVVGQQSHLFNF